LLLGLKQIDGLAVDEGELALGESGADSACNRVKHGEEFTGQ
jgi:hypothetical protein